MNKGDWTDTVMAATGLPKAQAKRAVDDIFTDVANSLLSGESVILPLVGLLKIEKTAARPHARNPRTGAVISVPAGERVKFHQGKTIKDQLAERNQRRQAA